MTLVVAAHNDKDIVIGSDTLTTVEIDGVKQPDIDKSKKIIKLNKKTALAVSGYMFASSKQFIADFCYNNKKEKNVSVLKDKLLANAVATLALDNREKLQLTLVGFEGKTPQIILVEFVAGAMPRSGTSRSNYFATGFDSPSIRAGGLLVEQNVEMRPKASELKKIVRDTLNTCIREFSDSDKEKLGGQPDIVVLRRS